jgi:arabinogalactan oligomer / maltooligosaccharide transport system permease protein
VEEKKTEKKVVAETSAPAQNDALASASELTKAFQPDPWYYTFGLWLGQSLVKLLLFVLGIAIDVLISLWKLIKGFFVGIYKGILGIGKLAVKIHRIWSDVDLSGKLSFFIQGLGNLRRKQWLDGGVFLALEILFVYFIAMFGATNLSIFFHLNDGATAEVDYGVHYWEGIKDARVPLINGIFTCLVIVAYVVVYIQGIKSMYDNYQIVHELEFRFARENQLYVLQHRNEFEEDLTHLNRFQIKRLMRRKYGYDELSARYIAQIPWSRVNYREENFLSRLYYKIAVPVYNVYDKVRCWIKKYGEWTTPLERFLDGKKPAYVNPTGYDAVRGELVKSNTRFRHTFDKYNNYLSTIRDLTTLEKVYGQSALLVKALYGEDPLSVSDGFKAYPPEAKIKASEAVSRVVGVFEIPLPLAREVTRRAIKCLNQEKKILGANLQNLEVETAHLIADVGAGVTRQKQAFQKAYRDDVLLADEGTLKALDSFDQLVSFYKKGHEDFVLELVRSYNLKIEDARKVYRDYNYAIASHPNDEAGAKAELAKHREVFARYHEMVVATPFHGQPTRALKRIKEFSDEKFATTVLSLPTIAAVVLVVIPLLASIIVAFTNWDQYHTDAYFIWSTDSFSRILNIFGGKTKGASYSYTFFHLLSWTLIWAVFATFTNYFFGIVLALLINRKSIHFKKVWRTIFVVSIAIPQFITLLAMSLLLSDNGAVNTWLLTQGWYVNGLSKFLGFGSYDDAGVWTATFFPFLSTGANGAFWPKVTVILVNMWIGIPYTMLSTSGILMNIPEDLYESSRIDGAGPAKQLFSITMPYVFFVTGPALLTQFIGNINNFNVIYFLTGGGPTGTNSRLVATAGETDLLVTWLYKLTVNSYDYSAASVIGLLVFIICAFFSLIVYSRLGSVKNEEEFQ